MAAGRRSKPAVRRVNLALQGGGAHGAFTWGALDRLLDEDDVEIEGVSATSAGAMNGAMLTTGLKIGGREEAKARLERFWRAIVGLNPLNRPPWSFWVGALSSVGQTNPGDAIEQTFAPAYVLGQMVSRVASPYQLNPANLNPLREALESIIDFDVVCREDAPRLYVCATDVMSGRAHVFTGEAISVDAILASACLPSWFQAVEIDGRPYWDGGFTGNPPIWPLIYHCECPDVVVVHVNPIERDETPRDPMAIDNRLNEIAFNSNLMSEMRAIETIHRLMDQGEVSESRYKRMLIHAVEDQETMRRLGISTKLTPDWRMIERLRDAGRAAMDRWITEHKDKIGRESSVDIRARYL